MKRKWENGFRTFALGLLSALLLTGCGSASKDTAAVMNAQQEDVSYAMGTADGGYGYYESAEASAEMPETESGAPENGSAAVTDSRKLIKNVDMSVETKTFDSFMNVLEEKVQELGGYIESSDIYNGSAYSGYRSSSDASLTLRIPQTKLNAFLEEVSDICNVIRRADSVEDVTLTYVDMESRRDALETEHGRLLELLEKAESLEDILTIEERLTNVRYQLESMEAQLRAMDNQVEYSTVYLSVSEVKELTPVEEKTLGQRITEGFADSLQDIGESALNIFIWFVVNLPHLAVWAAIAAAAVLAVKKLRRRRKAKKEKQKGEKKAGNGETEKAGEE